MAGFYPLPAGAMETALMYLHAEEPAGVMALDPCVGEGSAFKQLLDGLGIPYENACAVELEEGRGAKAVELLPGCNVLTPADFIGGTTRPAKSFSLIYCNPPYDDQVNGGSRVETRFLEKIVHLLRTDGVLLMVVPEATWVSNSGFRRELSRWFAEIMPVYPSQSDRPYNETLVFGVRRDNPQKDIYDLPVMQKKLDDTMPYSIPTLKNKCVGLKKNRMTDAELRKYLINSPLEKMVDVLNPIDRGRPPLALGEGHNGLLVSSGQAPPIVTIRDDKGRMLEVPHLVRGVSTKYQVLKESIEDVDSKGESFTKDIYTEIFALTMTVVLHTGEVIKLEQGSQAAADARKAQQAAMKPKLDLPERDEASVKSYSVLPGEQTARGSHGGIAV